MIESSLFIRRSLGEGGQTKMVCPACCGRGSGGKQVDKKLQKVVPPVNAYDPANALLSLGYVMLTNELAGMLEANGLDPFIGFFHGVRYGRKSLPLDIVEMYRQPVIDRLTLRLLNHRQFTADDFEGGKGGLRLQPEPLKRYLKIYEDHLRNAAEGSEGPSWRDRIKRQVTELKAIVLEGEVKKLYTWEG